VGFRVKAPDCRLHKQLVYLVSVHNHLRFTNRVQAFRHFDYLLGRILLDLMILQFINTKHLLLFKHFP
jgi:hypothetical protein